MTSPFKTLSFRLLMVLLGIATTAGAARGSPLPEGNHHELGSLWISQKIAAWVRRAPAGTPTAVDLIASLAERDRGCRDVRAFAHFDQFADYLSRRRETTYRCARGVRESLNFLFYGESGATSGADAHLWDLDFLNSHWSTPSCRYRQIPPNDSPEDFDVRVMTSPGRSVLLGGKYIPFGHVEFFYRGSWYSDHTQKSSYRRSTVAGLNVREATGRRLKPGELLFLRSTHYRLGTTRRSSD